MGPVLHPGARTTARGTHGSRNPAACPRGQAARGGTAPDTRRPSQQWQATPPGGGPPPPPRHAAPTGHASQGDSAGPPHPHTRAHSTWVTGPDSPPGGQAAARGGGAGRRRPSQLQTHPPRGPHSATPTGARAVGPLLGPHAPTNRTRDTRAAKPRLPAPEDGQLGEGQRLTPDAPRRAYGPRGQCWAPYPHTCAQSTWTAGPDSPQKEGSRRGESARPQTPPATGSPRTAGREPLMPTRTHELGPQNQRTSSTNAPLRPQHVHQPRKIAPHP